MTLFLVILAVVLIGVAIFLFTKKKKGPTLPQKPAGPSVPPTSPPPPPPPPASTPPAM